jgi:transcriptional regulator with XRE-family HTH domain
MDNLIGTRLQQIIDSKMLSASRFAKEVGISPQLMNAYLRDERKPSGKMLSLISIRFPEIDAHWLLTGDGEMLKPKQESLFPEMDIQKEQNKGVNMVDRLLNIIEKQQDELGEINKKLGEIEAYLYKKNNQG